MCILPPSRGSNLHLLDYRIDVHNLIHQVQVFPYQMVEKALDHYESFYRSNGQRMDYLYPSFLSPPVYPLHKPPKENIQR